MPPFPAQILVYRQDSLLLETRKLVLQHAGFVVTVALELQTTKDLIAERTFDLFILCHSLTPKNCEAALALTRSLHSGMKDLILSDRRHERSQRIFAAARPAPGIPARAS